MSVVLHVSEVSKKYGSISALDGVSLDIYEGEMVGVMGPNGSGKSTLISLVVGLATPDSGTVRLNTADPRSFRTRRDLGVCLQDIDFPPTLTVREIVQYVGAHYPSPYPKKKVLADFGLTDLERRTPQKLSGGQRRRLAVACAFIGNPDLVVLDEPSAGLDVEHRELLWRGVGAYVDAGGSILITSHVPDEVQRLSSRVAVLSRGRLISNGSAVDAISKVGAYKVTMRDVSSQLDSVSSDRAIIRTDQRVVFTDSPEAVRFDLERAGSRERSPVVEETTLEDVILLLASGGGDD